MKIHVNIRDIHPNNFTALYKNEDIHEFIHSIEGEDALIIGMGTKKSEQIKDINSMTSAQTNSEDIK